MNSKKLKRGYKNYVIDAQCGKRAIASSRLPNEMDTKPLYLCTLTKKGIKKNKTLAKYGSYATSIDNMFYYVKYTSKKGNRATLYKCKPNGTKRVKLGTFTGKGNVRYAQGVWISNITKQGCDVAMKGKNYHYSYTTKKLTEFDPSEYETYIEDEEDY